MGENSSRRPLTKANLQMLRTEFTSSEDSETQPAATLEQAKGSIYAIMRSLYDLVPEGHSVLKDDELYIAGPYDVRYRGNKCSEPDLDNSAYWIAKLEYFRGKYFAIKEAKQPAPPTILIRSETEDEPVENDHYVEYILNWDDKKTYIEKWAGAQSLRMPPSTAYCAHFNMYRELDAIPKSTDHTPQKSPPWQSIVRKIHVRSAISARKPALLKINNSSRYVEIMPANPYGTHRCHQTQPDWGKPDNEAGQEETTRRSYRRTGAEA
ncbi:hypothetical protein DL764_006969 [Monosporascus ibericus]|uniref:Uncharacterized protein n=1 Tax=Monosporascus ibericus TaxID=155417 RepID=A0A4Q4T6K5_9PEZI|nr:hypothetical protein DL764_006969 [Monosporascus ibericus]